MTDTRTEVRVPLCIAADHPSLAGHFPGQPVVPGVVLLDHVITALEQQDGFTELIPTAGMFMIPSCKFLAPVQPGANLSLSFKLDSQSKSVSFRLEQAGQLVATGSFKAASLHGDS